MRRLLALAVIVLVGAALPAATPPRSANAIALPFRVTKVADTNDGTCDADCSLREAIVVANAVAGANTVTVPPGVYVLTRGPNGDDMAAGGDLDVTGDLTIAGAGARRTVIDAAGIPNGERAIDVVGSGTPLTLTGATVRGGNDGIGGGIRSAGPLRVADAAVSGNRASSGGGIASAVRLTLLRTTVSGNETVSDGGGVHARGTAEIIDSTISGNGVTGENNGAAIALGAATMLTAINVMIAANRSFNPERGAITGPARSAKLQNTVLSNAPTANCFNRVELEQSAGNNISGDASCAFDQASDRTNTDPKLGLLRDNGGPTPTHALLAGSPALDAGANAACSTTDQRAAPRPQDGDDDGDATCDVGAFEFTEAPTVVRVAPAEDTTGVGPGANVFVTFSEAMRTDTVTGATVRLFRAGTTAPITAVVTYDAATKKAVLNPTATLRRGVRYKAVVSTGARDLAGNQLDQNPIAPGNQQKAWFFTVRP